MENTFRNYGLQWHYDDENKLATGGYFNNLPSINMDNGFKIL